MELGFLGGLGGWGGDPEGGAEQTPNGGLVVDRVGDVSGGPSWSFSSS